MLESGTGALSAVPPEARTISVRVLLIEDDPSDALAAERSLAGRYEIKSVTTLREAIREIRLDWRPDVIVADLDLPDSPGVETLERLREAAADTPIIVGARGSLDALHRNLDALSRQGADRHDGLAILRAMLQQQQALQHTIAAYRTQILAEIEQAATDAAEAVVSKALDQLLNRLGLEDAEGVRLAVRLARGWEAAKGKFLSAITTGLASALLLALGAGLLAMLRNADTAK